MGDSLHCISCGIAAADGQSFAQETVPLLGARAYCPNCHSRLRRRFFQAGLVLDAALGLLGLALVLHNPASSFGHYCLNLFLFQLCLVLATVPHEFGHALAGRLSGLTVEKIILGFGPPFFARRICGFPVECRQIPYGGSTHVHPPASDTALWRHLAFAGGGVFANFMLATLVWLMFGGRATATDFSGPISFWWLCFISNLGLAMQHLFPYVRSTPFGRMPSDGLALWQILVQRRIPSVAQTKEPPPVEDITFARRTAKRFTVAMFAAGAAACFAAVLFLARALFSSSAPIAIWVAVVLFVLLGGTFAWGAVFIYQRPWQPQRPAHEHAIVPHGDVLKAIETEISRRSPWPGGFTREKIWTSVEPASHGKHIAETLACLDSALAVEPGNMQLQLWKGQALGWAGRHAEAAAHYAGVLELGDLGLSIRAAFLLEGCKAHLRAGQRQAAWLLCGEYLDEPCLLPEQLYLLDNLARLPIEETRPEFLPDADYWSQQALALQPENLTLQTTRAAILFEQGRAEEAEPILRNVHARSEADADKALAGCYLAQWARSRGDDKSAARLVRQARLLQPPPWLIRRFDAILPARAA